MSEYAPILDAKKQQVPLIMTVEGFYKEPHALYDFLRFAANNDVQVIMAPIKTTDQSKYKEDKTTWKKKQSKAAE